MSNAICEVPRESHVMHVVGYEDATGSFPVGTKCFISPTNNDGCEFEGLHILEHQENGKRLAKFIQRHGGLIKAYSNDRGDVCKEFIIDISVPRPEWRSIGRVSWMFAKFK